MDENAELAEMVGPTTIEDVRPSVQRFAILMEQQLRKNDYKGGWYNNRPEQLWPRIYEELDELGLELNPFQRPGLTHSERQERIGGEAADVANFLMMITDVMGVLRRVDL